MPYASVDKFADIEGIVSEFRRGREESSVPADENSLVVALHTHVADTEQKARAAAEIPFNRYVDTRLYAHRSTYADAMQSGIHLFGSPQTVANKILELKRMGVGHVMALQNFGLLSQAHVHSSMTRLMRDVMPLVAGKVGAERAVA